MADLPELQLLPGLAALTGLVPILLGINALLRPRAALRILNFPVPKDAEAQKLVDSLMLMFGARDILSGVPVLLSWYFDRRPLGWLVLFSTIRPCTHAWALKRQDPSGGGEWAHFPFAVVGVALGLALVQQGRGGD